MQSNIVHGARVIFKFNGLPFTLGHSCNVIERFTQAQVDPVGQPEAAEHITVAYDVEGTFEMYRPSQKSLKSVGLVSRTARPKDVLEQEGVMLEVQDIKDNVVLERLTDVKVEEVTREYRKGTLTMYSCRFKAVKVTDEAEN